MASLYKGTKVIELYDNDFDLSSPSLKLKKGSRTDSPGMIKFYAAYCPYCVMKKETYTELANKLNKNGSNYKIYAVNIKDPRAVNTVLSLGISGIPAFYEVGKDLSLTRYEGEYNPDEILKRALSKGGKVQQSGGMRKTNKKPQLKMSVIREFIKEFPGVYATEVADTFGVSEETLREFINSKRDQYGVDPYGNKTKPAEMREANQIKEVL